MHVIVIMLCYLVVYAAVVFFLVTLVAIILTLLMTDFELNPSFHNERERQLHVLEMLKRRQKKVIRYYVESKSAPSV